MLLQLPRAPLKPQKGPYASELFGSIDRMAQEIIGAHLDTLCPILPVRKCRRRRKTEPTSPVYAGATEPARNDPERAPVVGDAERTQRFMID
jgi:hypothetical protein